MKSSQRADAQLNGLPMTAIKTIAPTTAATTPSAPSQRLASRGRWRRDADLPVHQGEREAHTQERDEGDPDRKACAVKRRPQIAAAGR